MPRAKVTFDTVRKIALALPGVEDGSAYGAMALKVNGKLLACVPANKSAEPDSLVVRMDVEQRDGMLREAPETYYCPEHYRNYPSVLVRLSNITPDQLRDLLAASLRYVTAQSEKKPKPARAKTVPARRPR